MRRRTLLLGTGLLPTTQLLALPKQPITKVTFTLIEVATSRERTSIVTSLSTKEINDFLCKTIIANRCVWYRGHILAGEAFNAIHEPDIDSVCSISVYIDSPHYTIDGIHFSNFLELHNEA